MRWVFLSLVCLNLLVMVWFWRDQAGMSEAQEQVVKTELQGKGLILLSELNRSQLSYKTKQVSEKSITDQRCYSVGPFKDVSDAKFLGIRAEALGFSSQMRSLATGGSIEHWVHIPPLANRQQSLQLLRELQGRGVDSYIITQGDLAEGISLGLFRNKQSADSLTKRMQVWIIMQLLKKYCEGRRSFGQSFLK